MGGGVALKNDEITYGGIIGLFCPKRPIASNCYFAYICVHARVILRKKKPVSLNNIVNIPRYYFPFIETL